MEYCQCLKNIRIYEQGKPEAAYFMPIEDHRSAAFILNMKSKDQVPAVVEPLCQRMGVTLDVIPVMNFEEVKNGLRSR